MPALNCYLEYLSAWTCDWKVITYKIMTMQSTKWGNWMYLLWSGIPSHLILLAGFPSVEETAKTKQSNLVKVANNLTFNYLQVFFHTML